MIELPAALTLARYRISLAPRALLALPAYKGAVVRGGLGIALKQGTCRRPGGRLCSRCEEPDTCAYAFLFEGRTPRNTEVLKASHDIPLPYVIEPPLDTRRELQPGELLSFHLVLVGSAIRYFPFLLAAFQILGEQGLGQDRVPCRLVESCVLAPDGLETAVYDSMAGRPVVSQPAALPVVHWVGVYDSPQPTLTLRFLTPTRLKHDNRYAMAEPEFHVVISALLRRVSSLSYFYGGQRWDIDYRGWIAAAESVQIDHSDIRWVDWERYSTRQHRSMNLGGIVGSVTYQGDLAPFLPLLRLGELVHVGKSAVFGNGRYQIVSERPANRTQGQQAR